jgi:tRNA1(Val) A37 N6-methylase TrmN6
MKCKVELLQGEQVDDLQYMGYEIIQKPAAKAFRFGVDAVLLSGFAGRRIRSGDTVVDLGTGTVIIPVLLGAYTEATVIHGIEIQEEMAEMASRSVIMNGLSENNRVNISCGDFCEIEKLLGSFCEKADVVTCNPPYVKFGGGIVNSIDSVVASRAIARHELKCTFDDVATAASFLLKQGGNFFLIHRPERLADIICSLREHKLEPKEIKFVFARESEKFGLPSLVLIRAAKGGNPKLKILPPFYIYDINEKYDASYEKMGRSI